MPDDRDIKFMWRALQLARGGEGRVSPNPMVGAVICHNGKIIGEGFHARYGGPHAEVNAINSVKEKDRPLLKESTIYVTLEPCAHFGKTPPCASLIVSTGIPCVVIGALDPNPLVAGKGIEILKNAGIQVTEGILKKECEDLNRRFIFAHTHSRPWIQLKWARSADGYMASLDDRGMPLPVKFSSSLSQAWMHKERAMADAIMVGRNTSLIDKPRLDVRLWGGENPEKLELKAHIDVKEYVEKLRSKGITSLMIEGGPTLLQSFINEGLYDEIREEISPLKLNRGLKAPSLPKDLILISSRKIRSNIINIYRP